jgi:DNA-binding GntR family transcriptional regulator
MQPEPLNRKPSRLVDDVHQRLLAMIGAGRLRPESRLHQAQLAEALGVSRTPVREALLRLEREGLVETRPGGGLFVRAIPRAEVRQINEARAILEPAACRLACERATTAEVHQIRAIHHRLERAYPRDLAVAFRTNFELHMSLVRPCRNELMLQFLTNIWTRDTSLRLFAFQTYDTTTVETLTSEHERIIDALAAGAADRVEDLLREHIVGAGKAIEERLEQLAQEAG